jgi:hypothetical protein
MKKLLIIAILFSSILSLQAQNIFSPIPDRVKTAFDKKAVKVDYLKTNAVKVDYLKTNAISFSSDSSVSLFSLTASTTALSYKIGANSSGKLLNGAGIGVSRVNYKLISGKAVPIWDISVLFMTSVKITDMTFTGAGGMVAIGFNPGYLIGVGGNIILREGLGYIGSQGLTNMNWYLCTSIAINL